MVADSLGDLLADSLGGGHSHLPAHLHLGRADMAEKDFCTNMTIKILSTWCPWPEEEDRGCWLHVTWGVLQKTGV